jgi:hypothetical protein
MIPWRSMRLAWASGRMLERREQRAVLSVLLAGREDRRDVEDRGGASEPEHVGLDLVAGRGLDDAIEDARLVVDEEEHHRRRRQWFRRHVHLLSLARCRGISRARGARGTAG